MCGALVAGDRENPDLLLGQQRTQVDDIEHHERDLTAQDVQQARAGALVGDVRGFEAEVVGQLEPVQVRHRAIAERGIVQRAFLAFGPGRPLTQGAAGVRGGNGEADRRGAGHGDRREILHRPVRQPAEVALRDREVGAGEQEVVALGRRQQHRLRGDLPCGARLVVDDHRHVAERRRQRFLVLAQLQVDRIPGARRRDEADRPARPSVGQHRAREGHCQAATGLHQEAAPARYCAACRETVTHHASP